MFQKEIIQRRPKDGLVPVRRLRGVNEMDEILRPVIRGRRKEVHAAIDEILSLWPGRKRSEIWAHLRRLRDGRREHRGRHAEWEEEDIEILRAYYVQGRAGAYRAVKELVARHPDWNPRSIWYKAAKLGISTQCEKPRPWSEEEEGKLLWDAGEKPVRTITRKLQRSEPAVRQKLSSNHARAPVRMPHKYNLHRISKLIGVSDTIVRRWFQKGLFGSPNSQANQKTGSRSRFSVSAQALEAFCEKHPEKINGTKCDPLVLGWLEEKGKQPAAWDGCRQHLVRPKSCPACGRTIAGNGYFRHIKSCGTDGGVPGK
jgi:hypothetical protein